MAFIGQRTNADAVTNSSPDVDRIGLESIGWAQATSRAASARESGRTTLTVEEWKHRFRRGDSDATAVVNAQASTVLAA